MRISKDGVLLYANDASQSLLDECGCKVNKRVPDNWQKMVREAFACEGEKRMETEHLDRTYSFVIAPITEAGYANIYGRDISERKQAEAALKTQRYYLEKAQEIGSIGTWELDISKNELIWTDENYRVFGVAIGTPLTYEIFLNCVHPDDREYVNAEWAAAVNGKPYDIEHRLVVDGKVKWVREKAELQFDQEGNGIRAIGFTQDITERKQAEKALRQSENLFRDFFANAPIGFHIFGPNQIITDINDAELDMIGYRRDEIVGKKTWADLIIPAQGEQFKKHWNDIITKGNVHNLEYTLVHKQGHHITVLLNASSRFDEIGQFINSRGSVLNITERKQNEMMRRQWTAKLEAKNKELEHFSGIIRHDFGNPVLSIDAFSSDLVNISEQLLQSLEAQNIEQSQKDRLLSILKDRIPTSVGFIREANDQMKSLLEGLRQVAAIGRFIISIESVDMNKLITSLVGTMKFQIRDCDASVTVEKLPSCLGDAGLLRQVFSNLLSNAIKYLDPNRKGQIHIRGRSEDSRSVFCVEDNGIGIEPKHQKKVFDIFYRVDPSDPVGGEGFGLSIASKSLERINGKIWVESESGQGSKFFVSLPGV